LAPSLKEKLSIIVDDFIDSENTAERMASTETPLVLLAGETDLTVGRVVSVIPPLPPPPEVGEGVGLLLGAGLGVGLGVAEGVGVGVLETVGDADRVGVGVLPGLAEAEGVGVGVLDLDGEGLAVTPGAGALVDAALAVGDGLGVWGDDVITGATGGSISVSRETQDGINRPMVVKIRTKVIQPQKFARFCILNLM
jgi:hypothetical protein